MDIAGKVCVITGSSSGVGAEVARMLAGRGCNVAVNYRDNETGAEATVETCRALGADAMAVRANVADDGDCRALAAAAIERWGRIDALVNSAGATRFVPGADLEGLSADDFAHLFAVNVTGAFQMVRAVTPHMKAVGRGVVVNISSLATINGVGSSVAYTASKGALNAMTLSLARALAPEIRVNCVCPGMINTRWNRNGLGDERYEEVYASFERTLPLGHVLEAEDVAGAIVWLIEGADYVTGEVLVVDSGMRLA